MTKTTTIAALAFAFATMGAVGCGTTGSAARNAQTRRTYNQAQAEAVSADQKTQATQDQTIKQELKEEQAQPKPDVAPPPQPMPPPPGTPPQPR